MTQQLLLKGLECPNCSAKIEKEIAKINGITSSSVNLITQTLTVNCDNTYNGDILEDVTNIVHSHESDVEVSMLSCESKTNLNNSREYNFTKRQIVRLAVGAFIYIISIVLYFAVNINFFANLAMLILAYLVLGADVVFKAVKNILKGKIFDENFLMTVSTVGAFAIGEYPEAVAVMLFYQIGELFQSLAVKRSRKSITDLMDIRPDFANIYSGDKIVRVSPETVAVGETIIIKPGEKIPLDGIVTDGKSTLDTVALTGESRPKSVNVGETVLSGCINLNNVIKVKVTKPYSESTAAKIMDLVENAANKKAPAENFITTFSRYYTPIVVILALILAVIPPVFIGGEWADWIRRGFVFLVISCPCALVISIPLTFFGGIGAASKKGVLVKGSNYLEALNNVEIAIFDKTGTLTKGSFKVTNVIPANGYTKDDVLLFASKAEIMSNHPIATSIMSEYANNAKENEVSKEEIISYEEIPGHGISVTTDKEKILAGNEKLMQKYNISFSVTDIVGTKVYVAVDGKYLGSIVICDEIKDDSKKAIEGLRKRGIKNCIMLTGDSKVIAKDIAQKIRLDNYFAELLPEEKVKKAEELLKEKSENGKLMFVGDGINDAAVLARADIGVAMGGLGSDAAIEAADVVLMTDEPSKLIDAIDVAKATKRIVIQNIVFSLAVKIVFLALGAFGIAGMWEAVFGDVGVMILAVLNAMRIMKK